MKLIDHVRDRDIAVFTFLWEDGLVTNVKIPRPEYDRRGYQVSRDLACKLALAKANAHCRATRRYSKEVF